MSRIAEHIAERLDHRGLACPRHARDADAQSIARLRQQALKHALGTLEVLAAVALDERDRTRERHAVAAGHALNIVIFTEDKFAVGHPCPVQQFRIDVADGQILDALDAAHDARRKLRVGVLGYPVGPFCGIFFAHKASFPTRKNYGVDIFCIV